MKLFVDSNILIAVITDEKDRFDEAKELLNSKHQIVTSTINLMEVRSVLAKKKNQEKSEIEKVEKNIVDLTDIILPDSSDFLTANRIQKENYAYPLDSILMAIAENAEAQLVSFDKELIKNGAKEPKDIL